MFVWGCIKEWRSRRPWGRGPLLSRSWPLVPLKKFPIDSDFSLEVPFAQWKWSCPLQVQACMGILLPERKYNLNRFYSSNIRSKSSREFAGWFSTILKVWLSSLCWTITTQNHLTCSVLIFLVCFEPKMPSFLRFFEILYKKSLSHQKKPNLCCLGTSKRRYYILSDNALSNNMYIMGCTCTIQLRTLFEYSK